MTGVGPVADGRQAVRIGTRGSALALAQARLVAEALAVHGVVSQMVIVRTAGDGRAPDTAWGEGAFVTAIEQAVLDGSADIAAHSAKDIPTDENPGLRVVAYLPREDARDALVVAADHGPASLATLPAGMVVGTDSPRRTGFLRARRPDLEVRPLHGNVDTRLRRLDGNEVGALVLAVCGLLRLGRADRISERLAVETLPPAPGQGAIAIQARADDEWLAGLGALVDHLPTHLAVEAERAFLRAAGGGCRAPIGALASVRDGRLHLAGGFATVNGRAAAVDAIDGSVNDTISLAAELAARLGTRRAALAGGRRVLVTRPADQSWRLAARLAEHGIEALLVPAIAIEPVRAGGALDDEVARLAGYDWVAVTSANGARALRHAVTRLHVDPRQVRWAAVGEATARELRAAGVPDAWQPARADAAALGAGLPVHTGQRVLLIRGSLADATLPKVLRDRGADVVEVIAYSTREAPQSSRPLLERALAGGPVAAVIFASPSAVRGLLALARDDLRPAVLGLWSVAIGPTTAAAVREAGFRLLGVAEMQDAGAVAELTAGMLDPAPQGAHA